MRPFTVVNAGSGGSLTIAFRIVSCGVVLFSRVRRARL